MAKTGTETNTAPVRSRAETRDDMSKTAKYRNACASEYESEARARGCSVEDLSGRTRKLIRERVRASLRLNVSVEIR